MRKGLCLAAAALSLMNYSGTTEVEDWKKVYAIITEVNVSEDVCGES